MAYVENKNRKTFFAFLIAAVAAGMIFGWWGIPRPVFGQSANQISVALSLYDSSNKPIKNGSYEVRFALYTVDRNETDAFPSNADVGNRVWEETQTIQVENGIVRAFIGGTTPFPTSLYTSSSDYYLGIRVGEDSEMIPRKRIGAVPFALNARYLNGATTGESEGNIPLLGKGGKLLKKFFKFGDGAGELVAGDDDRLHEQNTDTGTSETTFNIGSGTGLGGENFLLTVSSSASAPALRYNAGSSEWEVSNDGSTFSSIGGSGTSLPLSGGTMTGNITFAGTQTFTNLINLGSDTVGNYVATITAGNGISGSASSEGATPTIAVDLLDSADGTGSTSSNSGFEFAGTGSNELALLQGCANNEVLAWADATNTWGCQSVSGVGGLTGSGTTNYVAYWSGTNALAGEAQLSVSRGGTGVDGSAATNGALLIGNGSGYSLATLSAGNGMTIANGAGSITLSVDATTTGTTATSSSNSGIEATAGGIRLLGGCSNDQVLAWNSGSSTWACSNKTGGTSDWTSTGSVTYLTDTTDDVAFGGSTSTNSRFYFDVVSGNQIIFEGTGADDANETTLVVANPTADRTLTLPNTTGTIVSTGNLTDITAVGTIASGTWNGGTIAVGYGGTGAATLASNGILYGNGTGAIQATSAAANSLLVTNGSNVPSLATDIPTGVTIGGAYVYRVGGTDITLADGGTGTSLTDPNADRIFFWDDSAGSTDWLSLSSNLAISGTTLDVDATLQLGSDGTDGTLTIFSEQGVTDYTTVFQPGTQTQNITYTLPADDGTSGYVLITDGSGGLSWASVTGGAGGMASFSVAGDSGTPQTISDSNTLSIAGGTNISTVASATDILTVNLDASITLGSNGTDGTLTIFSEQGVTDYSTTFQPGTQTQDITYTLPANDGDADQALVSDGSGNLSWQTLTGVGGVGDITAVGNVTNGAAFDGTAGTELYFNDADGDGTLTIANLSAARTYTLPNATGTVITTGNITDITGLTDSQISDTLTASIFIGSGSTTNAVDLATAEVSGILPVANGGTGASSLSDLITLTTHTAGNYVASITNGSGISGGNGGSEGAALTLALGALTADWNQTGAFDIALNNASSELKILESAGATFYGILDVTDLSADRTLTIPDVSGTIITTGDTGTVTGTMITNDTVVLSTDTAGNYVSSATASGGLTMTGTEGASLGILLPAATNGLSTTTQSGSGLELLSSGLALLQGCADNDVLSWDETNDVWKCNSVGGVGAGDITAVGNVTSGAAFDGTAGTELYFNDADGDGTLTIANLSAARTYTLPDATGTILLSGHTFTGDVTATLDSDGSTALTIAADSVTLGTDTTGNYVATIADSGAAKITVSGSGSENAAVTLGITADSLDFSDLADSLTLDAVSTTIGYTSTAANDPLLGLAITANAGTDVTQNIFKISNALTASTTDTSVDSLLFLDNADTTASGTTVVTDAIKITNSGGSGFTNFLNTPTLDISAAGVITGATGITSSGTITFSGFSTNGGLLYTNGSGVLAQTAAGTSNGILHGGTTPSYGDVVLSTETSGNYVATITAGNGISGSASSEGATPTIALSALTADWDQTGAFDIALNNASSEFKILESVGATFYGILDAGNLSADRTLTMPDVSGTIATLDGGQTFTSATWNGTAISAQYGGTGINTSASTGIPTISSGTWSVSASLGVTSGGTGTTTQFTQGSIVFAGASGVYSQDNSNFFWDDTNNRLGIGTTSPAVPLHVYGTGNGIRLSYDTTNYGSLAATSAGNLNITATGDVSVGGAGTDLIVGDVSNAANLVFEESSTISGQGGNTITMGVSGDIFTLGVSGVTYNYGTITSGTWNATAISSTYGGTGLNTSASTGVATVSSGTWAIASVLGVGTGGTGTSTQFTQGSVVFAGAAGVYTQDNASLYFDDSANMLGIGTASPAAKLDVSLSSTSTTAGTEYGFRDTVSDTGIVTTGTDTTYGSYTSLTRTGATGGTINTYGNYVLLSTDNAGSGTSAAYGSYIDTGVSGATNADTVYGQYITTEANAGTAYGVYVDVGSGAGTEYSGIFLNGNLGIGDATPSYRLEVNDDISTNYVAQFFNDGNNADRYGIQIQGGADDASGTTYYINALDGDGGQVGYIANTAGTFALTDVSDIRTKTNIVNTEMSSATSILNSLRVVDFNRTSDPDGPRITGFIAQEVDLVYPQAVTTGPTGLLGLAKEAFIPVLVKGFQESETRLTEAESAITSIDLKTDTNATTLDALKVSVDANLLTIAGELSTQQAKNLAQDTSLTTIETDLAAAQTNITNLSTDVNALATRVTTNETDVATIKAQLDTLTEFYSTFDLGNFVAKDLNGDVDLLNGKLRARVIETGAIVIENATEDAPTIGTAELLPIATDIDLDGNDDYSGLPMTDSVVLARDGKSVTVLTNAMIPMVNGSRIFTTFKGNPNGFNWVEKVKNENGDYIGFKILVSEPIVAPVKIDWLLVEEKK